jgi:hypothetical protein
MNSQLRQHLYLSPVRSLVKPFISITRTAAFLAGVNAGLNKPTPHHIKVKLIKARLARLEDPQLVETGTYLGDTVAALEKCCSRIFSIEVDPVLCANAQRRFKRNPNIQIFGGDCLDVFPRVLELIKVPVVFWLDAHCSGGITGRGKIDDPILLSLAQLKEHPLRTHTILIDDARTFDGRESRPALLDVVQALAHINPEYRLSVVDDIVIAEI